MKSFKLHALHIHQDKNILPIVDDVEAKYICQVTTVLIFRMNIKKRIRFSINGQTVNTFPSFIVGNKKNGFLLFI
jgi:hypothetical protein